jgi:hypothetical protein
MVRILIIIGFLLFGSCASLSQTEALKEIRSKCCSRVGDSRIKNVSNHDQIITLADYVFHGKKIPTNCTRFINDRSELTIFTIGYRDSNKFVAFLDEDSLQVTVKVEAKIEITDSLDVEYFIYESDTLLQKISGRELIGFRNWSKTIKRVQSIEVSFGQTNFFSTR